MTGDSLPDSQALSADKPDPHEVFANALIGTRVGERYVVSRVLGMGAMGVVVAANHPELDQDMAVKIMFPEHAANRVLSARFAREARLAAKLQSPHLVRVFDVGRLESGIPFLVMEKLSGRDLSAELEERGAFPVTQAVDYLLQAMTGIAEIHALGFVHRDLKPSNLFLANVAGTPTVKVLDFGISKESTPTSSGLTSTESMLGTPSHMSPEQITATKEVDRRTDIWALGVILYEFLTGSLPFELEGDSVGELLAVILFKDPIPLRAKKFTLPLALEGVLLRCLRRPPQERYQDVLELAEALRPFASAEATRHVDAIRRVVDTEPNAHRRATPSAPSIDSQARTTAADPGSIGRMPVAARRPTQHSRSLSTSTRSIDRELPLKRRVPGALILAACGFLATATVVGLAVQARTPSTDTRGGAAMVAPDPPLASPMAEVGFDASIATPPMKVADRRAIAAPAPPDRSTPVKGPSRARPPPAPIASSPRPVAAPAAKSASDEMIWDRK